MKCELGFLFYFRPSFNVDDFLDSTPSATTTTKTTAATTTKTKTTAKTTTTARTTAARTTTEFLSVPLPNIRPENGTTQEDKRLEHEEEEDRGTEKRFRGGLGWVRPTPKGFTVRQGIENV